MKIRTACIIGGLALGIFFGLMFNMVHQSTALTRMMLARQGESVDLLRAMADDYKTVKASVQGLEKRMEIVSAVAKRIEEAPLALERPQPPQEDLERVYDVPVGRSAVKGAQDAPIVITGFLDVQCPFSKRFQPVINEVLSAYPGQVSYVVKNFPLGFHENAVPAAKAMFAAGLQGKYWEMLEGVLANNNQLGSAKYEEIAKAIGLDLKRFRKDLKENDAAWDQVIQADIVLGMEVDVRGTPTYYLNGRKTRARSLDAFKAEIDTILQGMK